MVAGGERQANQAGEEVFDAMQLDHLATQKGKGLGQCQQRGQSWGEDHGRHEDVEQGWHRSR